MTEFGVLCGDVLSVPSDLLILKHAQGFYGADRAVMTRLVSAGLCTEAALRPGPDEFIVVDSAAAIAPKRVLFLGTPPLHAFTYDQMFRFSRRAVQVIAEQHLPVRTITTTVHGTGYGLDGGESLQRLVRGFRDGLSEYPDAGIEEILFLTLGERAERMLERALKVVKREAVADSVPPVGHPIQEGPRPQAALPGAASSPAEAARPAQEAARTGPETKERVFVAMPFSEEFQNVYEFGIYPAVRSCDLICERVDETHFTGDILERIRNGIETASLVIADLTEARPNVYLEVGYAWGKGVPVIIVARKGEQLHFDVSTHRCLFYGRFNQFAKDLEGLIRGIQATRGK